MLRRNVVVFVLSLLGCSLADAGTITGSVSRVIQRSTNGLTYVVVSGTASGKPACAAGTYWMIADENSESGKKQYAMLLMAMATGRTVKIVGRNSCIRWSDGEDIDYIQLMD